MASSSDIPNQVLNPRIDQDVTPVTNSVPNVVGDTTSYQNVADATLADPTVVVPPMAIQTSDAPNDLMARTRRLASFVWSSAAAFGTMTVMYPFNELFVSLSDLVNVTDYTYIAYDSIKLRFTPNTTKFYRGMLGVTFIPLQQHANSGTYYNPTALSSLPTTYIDASSVTSVEMTVPYCASWPKIAPNVSTYMTGYIMIWVVDPLSCETAPGVTSSITLNIEASFNKPQLLDPQNNGITVPAIVARKTLTPSTGSFVLAQGPRKKSSVTIEAEKKAEKGAISGTLEAVSSIASVASAVPVVGGFASGLAVVTSAASKVFDWFGLSKPPNLSMPSYQLRNPLPFASTFHGSNNADSLSTDLVPYASTDPQYVVSDRDETSLSYLLARPNLVQRWVTGTLSGDTPLLLGSMPVHPRYGWREGDIFIPSNLAIVANCFRNWRGDIAFKLVIPATPMTRVRLAVMYSLSQSATFSENSRFMFIEVEGTTVVDGVIPHTHQDLYRTIPGMSLATPNSAASANGYLHVFQMSNLVGETQATTPTPLSILVFAGATTNTQFCGYWYPMNGAMVARITNSQGFLGLEQSLELKGVMPEDDIKSIREILHRPVPYGPTSTYSPPEILMPATGGSNSTVNWGTPNDIWYWLALFKFWRGSVTITVVARTASGNLPNTAIRFSTLPTLWEGGSTIHWVPSLAPKFSFTIPWNYAARAGDTGAMNNVTVGKPDVWFLWPALPEDMYVRFLFSMNDDLSLGIPVPPLGFQTP